MISLAKDPPSLDEILESAGLKSGGVTSRGASFWSSFGMCEYDAALLEKKGFSYQQETSPALITGFIVHECLAQWYKTFDRQKSMEPLHVLRSWAENNLSDTVFADHAQVVWECCKLSERLVSQSISKQAIGQYATVQQLGGPDGALWDFHPSMVKMVEHKLVYSGDFEYSARADLILMVLDENNEWCVVIVDHKTLTTYTQQWTEAFLQDLQFMGLPFLWNEVMVPQGYPECRYVIANGIVKDPKEKKNRFVRDIFLVRQNRIDIFKRQMRINWEKYQRCHEREIGVKWIAQEEGRVAFLDEAWQRNWACCQSRRYGRRYSSWIPKELGEVVPDGGRCHRFLYCLHDDAYPEILYDGRQNQSPQQVVEQVVEETKVDNVLTPVAELSCPPPPIISPQETEDKAVSIGGGLFPGVEFKVPIPKSSKDVLSIQSAGEHMPVGYIPLGETLYCKGIFYWVVGIQENGNREVVTPDCLIPQVFNANTICYPAIPVLKEEVSKPVTSTPSATTSQPPSTQPELVVGEGGVSTEVESTPPILDTSGRSDELTLEEHVIIDSQVEVPSNSGNGSGSYATQQEFLEVDTSGNETPPQVKETPVGKEVSIAPLSGVGMVPVRYSGSFNQGGKRLHPILASIYKEYPSPFYGGALIGRDSDARKLQLFAVKSEGDFEKVTSKIVGTTTWEFIEDGIKSLLGTVGTVNEH
jgi:hypothetical protein